GVVAAGGVTLPAAVHQPHVVAQLMGEGEVAAIDRGAAIGHVLGLRGDHPAAALSKPADPAQAAGRHVEQPDEVGTMVVPQRMDRIVVVGALVQRGSPGVAGAGVVALDAVDQPQADVHVTGLVGLVRLRDVLVEPGFDVAAVLRRSGGEDVHDVDDVFGGGGASEHSAGQCQREYRRSTGATAGGRARD